MSASIDVRPERAECLHPRTVRRVFGERLSRSTLRREFASTPDRASRANARRVSISQTHFFHSNATVPRITFRKTRSLARDVINRADLFRNRIYYGKNGPYPNKSAISISEFLSITGPTRGPEL